MSYFTEELALKLKEIFGGFLVGKIPRDDSLLEKVSSWLQNVLVDSASCSLFLSSTNFVGCLNGVRFQLDIDAQVWAFLLRLSGHIVKQLPRTATTLDFFHEAVRTGFKETVDRTDLWSQASIRCAWLQGMQLMIAADHQLLSDDVLKLILQCLEDSSWFVTKAAMSFTSQILGSELKSSTDDLAPAAVKYVLDSLSTDVSSTAVSPRRFAVGIEILENICHDPVGAVFLDKLLPNGSLVGLLCDALEAAALDKANENRAAILRVLSELWESNQHKDEICERLIKLSEKLVLSSCLSVAMEMSAWVLLRCNCTAPTAVMLENICLIPLWISAKPEIADDDLSQLLPIAGNKDCRSAILSTMNSSKANHTALVKLSLTILVQLKDHLIQKSIIYDLVKGVFLHMTGLSLRQQPLLQATNPRCKYCCLDILHNLIQSRKEKEIFVEDFSILVFDILSKLNHDQMMMSKAFALLIELLKMLVTKSQDEVKSIFSQLLTIVQKNISSPNWDIRDTTVSFVEQLLSLCLEENVVSKWAEGIDIVQYISACLSDSEAYVRASALNALGTACCSTLFCSENIRTYIQQSLWPDVLRFCENDEEIFSHRAAISLICKIYHRELIPSEMETVERTMFTAIFSSDWDVKIKSVDFWAAYALNVSQQQMTGKESTDGNAPLYLRVTKQLARSGCLKALLIASQDCDKSVQLRALKAIRSVKEELRSLGLSTRTEKCGTLEELCDRFMPETEAQAKLKGLSDETVDCLFAIDLDDLIDVANSSTDCHEDNPNSLLEDLLKSLVIPLPLGSGFTSSEEEDCDEMTTDCY